MIECMTDVNNYFERLERALKKLNVVIVDDYEEMKRGAPGPALALLRKLLFHSSTVVMKYMLLRGCPSHSTDRKIVSTCFDMMRESMKYRPSLSIDQFCTTGFAHHKLQILTQVVEYVIHVDRGVISRSAATKQAFIVPSDLVASVTASIEQNMREEALPINNNYVKTKVQDARQRASPTNVSSRASSARIYPPGSSTPLRTSLSGSQSGNSSPVPLSRNSSRKNLLGSPDINGFSLTESTSPLYFGEEEHPPSSSIIKTSPATTNIPVRAFQAVDESFIEQMVSRRVDAMIPAIVAQVTAQANEAHQISMAKLVAAVDAEFLLLGNKIKMLEGQLIDFREHQLQLELMTVKLNEDKQQRDFMASIAPSVSSSKSIAPSDIKESLDSSNIDDESASTKPASNEEKNAMLERTLLPPQPPDASSVEKDPTYVEVLVQGPVATESVSSLSESKKKLNSKVNLTKSKR